MNNQCNICINILQGYKYAATQNGTDCWCSNDYGKHGLADDECYTPCSGSPSDDVDICGGDLKNDVYSILPTNSTTCK